MAEEPNKYQLNDVVYYPDADLTGKVELIQINMNGAYEYQCALLNAEGEKSGGAFSAVEGNLQPAESPGASA